MAMGDLVLIETEINPVMSKLIENGIEITAIHNHVLRANPLPFYMHIGAKGQDNNGIYQFAVPRRDPISEHGAQIAPPGPTGVAIAINFQSTGGGKAAITGDFVLIAEEVNPVIKALRANGIEVTAVHSHMLTEQPRLIFMHFWANDDALKLAKGLREALDKTASAKS